MNIGFISYVTAAILFAIFTLLLMTRWRGRLEGRLLVAASGISTLWAVYAAYLVSSEQVVVNYYIYHSFEAARNISWYLFLYALLGPLKESRNAMSKYYQYSMYFVLLFVVLTLISDIFLSSASFFSQIQSGYFDIKISGHLFQSVIGLILVEQVFRNTRVERRWAIKYLFLGIGAIFMYDFFVYADALLFKRIDMDAWYSRGFINALIVPMLAMSVARNPDWSLDIFISRKAAFHMAALFGAGFYLMIMAGAGFYIGNYGGSWGTIAQAVFLFAAILFLIALLFSGQIRAQIKVFLSKHFFNYKYDYREEWLRLSKVLESSDSNNLQENVIRAFSDLMDSSGGMLWLKNDSGLFYGASNINMISGVVENIRDDSSLVEFMEEKQWIIDLHEYEDNPELYQGVSFPSWLLQIKNVWLVVPLFRNEVLMGFIILAEPRASRQINWEDRDLLKTAGYQVANQIALLKATRELVDARQFEAFNRLSSFIVHDLKNLSAQLSLILSNSSRHKSNPEFVDDMISTVENVTDKMSRMLSQLRKGIVEKESKASVNLKQILTEVVSLCSGKQPVPEIKIEDAELCLYIEQERLINVLSHLVQNAQEATLDNGIVEIYAYKKQESVVIEILDNGIGMTDEFINDRLFRPFDTTKGNAGMGIGVYESREFMWSQGGDISVNSQEGMGTVFRIALPVYNRDMESGQNLESNTMAGVCN